MHCINVLCASKNKNYILFLFEYVRPRAAENALPQGEERSCVVLGGLDIKDGAYPGYGPCAWGSPSTIPAAPAFLCHPSAWHTKLAALGIRPHTALILAFQTAELCRKIMFWCVVGKGVIFTSGTSLHLYIFTSAVLCGLRARRCPWPSLLYSWSNLVWACSGGLIPDEFERGLACTHWLVRSTERPIGLCPAGPIGFSFFFPQ